METLLRAGRPDRFHGRRRDCQVLRPCDRCRNRQTLAPCNIRRRTGRSSPGRSPRRAARRHPPGPRVRQGDERVTSRAVHSSSGRVIAPDRSDVVSSFTIIKGTMVDETYAVFAAWDLTRTKRENLDRLRAENYIGATSATWLRDVSKVLNRRFDPAGRDRALVILAQSRCSLEEWKPILLWHITRDEFLLRDFLESWLFPLYDAGAYRVHPGELDAY